MRRNVFTDHDFQLAENGFLVDNQPWQGEIRRRVEDAARWAAPQFSTTEQEEVTAAVVAEPEALPDPRVVYEETLEKARREAQELTDRIFQEARENASREAEVLRETASREAEQLKAQAETKAREEAETLKRQAEAEGREKGHQNGRQEGLEAGRAEGRRDWEARIREWDGLLRTALEERKKAVADLEGLLVELVGDALHRCLQREAQERPAMVVDLVSAALKRAHDRVLLKIHLNPEDVERVSQLRQELQLSVGAGELTLVADGRVEKGGCLIETEAGSVDARLSVLATQAQDALKSSM